MRTNNFYPPGIYAEKIAAALYQLHKSKGEEPVELYFDDINLLIKKRKSTETGGSGQPEDDSADLDDMLEDDFDDDDDFTEKDRVKKIPLKAGFSGGVLIFLFFLDL